MKKIIVFLLTAVLCLTTLSVTMAAEEDLHSVLYPIEKFTPVIDGKLDPEYKYSRVVNLRDNGPEFAKGQIYYLWDDNALYFYVTIQDATPGDAENGVDHESDCIELLFSLYNFDVNATNITAKQASDIGDAQFRVFRSKALSSCSNIIDNGIIYPDGSHGGFAQWVYNNTPEDHLSAGTPDDPSYIMHWDDATGYGFEGFVKWSPQLKEKTIAKDVVIGLGIQVNDDINADNKRDKKCYNENAAPNDWSMSTNRATCGHFQLVDNGYLQGGTENPPVGPDVPTSDPSVIFALFTVISAGGFTLFAAKKAKND